MQDYYNRRAAEYDAIYLVDDHDRQAELSRITDALQIAVQSRDVLEVACGTGYWTAVAAGTARSVTATDASEAMLAIAANKVLPSDRVTWLKADAYRLSEVAGSFNAGVAAFWFSHVARRDIAVFLTGLHTRLEPGSNVFMIDNVYVPGIGGTLLRPENSVDTFKLRTLSDGTQHTILKNYYSEDELRSIFAPFAAHLQVQMGTAYWWCAYSIP